MIKVKDLKPNPTNPRGITEDDLQKLVQSISDFPKMMELRPIVVDSASIVQGGNMRLKAIKRLGMKEIPDSWVKRAEDFSPEELREFIIKDNVGFGSWDWDALANEWDPQILTKWGLQIPLFAPPTDPADDGFIIPDEIRTDIVPGDLFQIGPHRLLCGSSLEDDNWGRLLGHRLVDMVTTDPPYNVDLGDDTIAEAKRRKRRTDLSRIQNDKMSDLDFYAFLLKFYTTLGNRTKPGGAWYVWHADSEVVNFRRAMVEAGLLVKQGLVWKKSSLVMGRQDYQWNHEPCLYGWRKGGAHKWYGDRKQTTVMEFDKPSRNTQHPTMKPVPLIAYQIANSSQAGDLVADGFLGSGTTMVAAEQLGRICYGTELDPKYCQVTLDRMIALAPGLEILRNGAPYTPDNK